MGETVSQLKSHAEDEALANDSLNSLLEIAKTKLEVFQQKVINSGNDADKQLPIKHVLLSHQTIRCEVEENPDALAHGVTDTIGAFANGDFVTGIANVLSAGLNAVFGNYSANTSEKQGYMISVGPTFGFYRVDYYIYSYQFTSEKLTSLTKNVVCFCYSVSSVDVSKMTLNDLRVVVGYSYGNLINNTDTQDKELLFKLMAECEIALQTAKADEQSMSTMGSQVSYPTSAFSTRALDVLSTTGGKKSIQLPSKAKQQQVSSKSKVGLKNSTSEAAIVTAFLE